MIETETGINNNYLNYSSLTFQFAIIIGFSAFVGYKLDAKFNLKPILLITGLFFGMIVAHISIYFELKKMGAFARRGAKDKNKVVSSTNIKRK